MNKLKIEYMPLKNIKRWERNPKDHDLGELHQSIKRFNFVSPIIIDEKSGKLVAGHGRLDALQQMKASGEKPPKGIIVKDESWFVPVIRGNEFANDDEREAYGIADNRLVELGGYNEEQLAQVLSDLAASGEELLLGTGYDVDDVDALLKKVNPSSVLTSSDEKAVVTYAVIIECESEEEQARLIDQLERDGIKCRAFSPSS